MIPLDLPPTQVQCIEKAVHSETRGIANGPDLVVAVILNRTNHPKFPDTPCEVVYQKHQFTGIRKAPAPSAASKKATQLALQNAQSLNQDVLYFHNTSVKPSWTKRLKRVIQKGTHIFYGEKK
jgi:spore germination cell wall hydrolase CwlJ-like protein